MCQLITMADEVLTTLKLLVIGDSGTGKSSYVSLCRAHDG